MTVYTYKYPIGAVVCCEATGQDPPFEGNIADYEKGNYIVFDAQRAKRWKRREDQLTPKSSEKYTVTTRNS